MHWWNRPVTAHYHGKDYMDIVGKIGVAPMIARKFIRSFLLLSLTFSYMLVC